MLRNNLELIVQYPTPGGYRCRGFAGLHLVAPAYVVFDGAAIADQETASLLGNTFCDEVKRFAGVTESAVMPCQGGLLYQVGCHAISESTCQKILVRPAAAPSSPLVAPPWPSPSAEAVWLAHWPQPTWQVIPVLPAGASVQTYVPPIWQPINVSFWTRSPTECLWAVMQRAGLAPEESRLFISYVRRDTTAVADQLFRALTEAGFDVFLDRCSVPLGVVFQERLMQDLCDKAMVVLLNSPSVGQSHWVEEEIAVIKTYRLGLLELRFPNAKQREDIDPDFSQTVDPGDLTPAGPEYVKGAQILTSGRLQQIVDRVKQIHGRALHRRRYELIDNFAAAVTAAGKTARMLADGTFLLPPTTTRGEAVVGLTPRPPELSDFCLLHQRGNISTGRAGWLISPAPFFLAHRQAHVSWLGGVSNIQHTNEAQIAQLAASL